MADLTSTRGLSHNAAFEAVHVARNGRGRGGSALHISDIVKLVAAAEPKPGKRGPYKKRVA